MVGKLPHEDVVFEIKDLMVSLNTRQRLSDDMDMYYVEKAGYSPMLEAVKEEGRKLDRAALLSAKLLEFGYDAADAVAKGLRMQGQHGWRSSCPSRGSTGP